MKVLNLRAAGELVLEEQPAPKAKKEEVLVKIKASGICGSDIPRVMTKGTYHFPTIVGHEFAGQIVAVGSNIHTKYLFKRATVFPLLPDFTCDMCEIEQYASCYNYNYFGSRCDGGFAEYIAVPFWNVVFADDNADYEELALAEPCAVGLHALRQSASKKGETVAIFGAGPIGLMIAQWVDIYGGYPILIDIDQRKADFAVRFGFTDVFAGNSYDVIQFIKEKTNGTGADICIEGTGFAGALESCLYAVKHAGRVVALGNPADDMHLSHKTYWEILRKQITLLGAWNSGYEQRRKDNDWRMVIDCINKGKINLKGLITHRYKLDDGILPFKMMTDKINNPFYVKVIYSME